MTEKKAQAIDAAKAGRPVRDDGGPAYPNPYFSDVMGMSLRDYFAAQALIGVAMAVTDTNESITRRAYALADAMLRARSQP